MKSVLANDPLMNSKAEFVLSKRGTHHLALEGFNFRKKKQLKNGETFWACSRKNCNAKVFTVGEDHLINRWDKRHFH